MFTSHQNQRFREIAERVSDCRRKVRKYELMGRVEQDRDDLYDLLVLALTTVEEYQKTSYDRDPAGLE